MKSISIILLCLLSAWISPAFAGSLKGTRIQHAINDVRVVANGRTEHPARAQEVLAEGSALSTGPNSRAEIVFSDLTLARLGAETSLRLKPGTRELVLERGTLLVQVPAFRGGVRVHAGSLSAVLGNTTTLIEHLPTANLKIVVLEGDTRVRINAFLGDSLVLEPGNMLLCKPDVRQLPTPVDVDLQQLAKTSALIDPTAFRGGSALAISPLLSWVKIERSIERQAGLIKRKTLFRTNLAIVGSGTNMVILNAAPATNPAIVDAMPATTDASAPPLAAAMPSGDQNLAVNPANVSESEDATVLPEP